MFSPASFTRCLRPLVAKSHYGSCCSLLSLIDLTYPTCLSFYWFQSFLRLNSNNQLRDFTRRHFILPHFHPLQSGLKGVREEGKKEGGGGGGAGQRGVLLLSHMQCFCVYRRHEKKINNPGFFSPDRISMLLRRCGRYTGNDVEGLNGPKCNKVLNVITICPTVINS